MLLLPPPPAAAPPRKPRNLVVPFFKDLPKLALVFVTVVGASGLVASTMQPKHHAEALLYVRYGREYNYRADAGQAEMAPQNFEAEQALKAEARILSAPELAAKVVERMGVATLYPALAQDEPGPLAQLGKLFPAIEPHLPRGAKPSPKDAATRRFIESMHAEAGDDGNIITVAFGHPDATIATRALDQLIAVYLERRRALFTDQRATTLQPEVDGAHAKLVAADDALTSYRARNGIVSFDAQRAQLLEQKAATQVRLESAEAERNGLAERLARLRQTLAKTPPTLVVESSSGDGTALDRARETLLQLQLEERRLLSEYKEKSPFVIEVRQRIAQAERFLEELRKKPVRSTRQGRNPVHDTLATQIATVEGDLAAAESRRAVLKQQLAAATEGLLRLDGKTAEMTRLTRARELAEQTYRLLAAKYEETRVLDQIGVRDDANVRVAQSAMVGPEPKDLRPVALALGLVAAIVASLLVALVSDLLRRGFLTPEDLERETGLPVLAALPVRRIRPWSPSPAVGMEGV
jgi:uncharacterized protein involved in exopolysaccharide biosynthesis